MIITIYKYNRREFKPLRDVEYEFGSNLIEHPYRKQLFKLLKQYRITPPDAGTIKQYSKFKAYPAPRGTKALVMPKTQAELLAEMPEKPKIAIRTPYGPFATVDIALEELHKKGSRISRRQIINNCNVKKDGWRWDG